MSTFPFYSDKKYEAVVLPLFGVATPFHISTIKVGTLIFFHVNSEDLVIELIPSISTY